MTFFQITIRMKRKRIEESSKKPPLKRQNATVTNATIVRSPIASNIDVNDYKVTDLFDNPSVGGTGYIQSMLRNLTPGVGFYNEFIGSKMNIAGIQFRFGIVNGDNTNMCRIMLFQWMQEVVPAINGVLQTFSVYAPINADNRENIIVLRDILLPLYAHGQANVHLDGSMVYVKGKKCIPCFGTEP